REVSAVLSAGKIGVVTFLAKIPRGRRVVGAISGPVPEVGGGPAAGAALHIVVQEVGGCHRVPLGQVGQGRLVTGVVLDLDGEVVQGAGFQAGDDEALAGPRQPRGGFRNCPAGGGPGSL